MLFLTFCNILLILVLPIHASPSPQKYGPPIIVPTIPTYPEGGSGDTGTGGVVVPTTGDTQDDSSDSSNSDNSPTSGSGYNRQRIYGQGSGTGRGYGGYRPVSDSGSSGSSGSSGRGYDFRPTNSNTPQKIIKSSQTCAIPQDQPSKGVDKIGQSCTSFGVAGVYSSISSCPMDMSEAGDYSKDAYPTSNGIQCCAPKSCTVPSKNADGDTIDPDKYVGKCMNKHKGANCAYYKGFYIENLCPGPFTIQCCVIPKDNLPDSTSSSV